jgi:plasmid stabilization system protein ParE
MARLIWAPKALEDLRALLEYIARDAPTAAARFGEKLVARVEAVAANPL